MTKVYDCFMILAPGSTICVLCSNNNFSIEYNSPPPDKNCPTRNDVTAGQQDMFYQNKVLGCSPGLNLVVKPIGVASMDTNLS